MKIDLGRISESLSPNERKILPYLEEKNLSEICKKTNLDKTSVIRALEYLGNKKLIELFYDKRKIVVLGVNGALYQKKGLPERRLLNLLSEKRIMKLPDTLKQSLLSDDEFKVSIGYLKNKNLIEIKSEKIIFNANRSEISKKTPEEIFLESLPLDYDSLNSEQKKIFDYLRKRREIIQVEDEKIILIKTTELGKKIIGANITGKNLIEQITPEILRKEALWKGKKFRRYNVEMAVPYISGGRKHFVSQAVEYARKIWIEMGFEEMTGNLVVSSFWNFDALFTAQDHSVREMQDTFFINEKEEISERKILKNVKESHEKGVGGSSGWMYDWNEEEAKKLVLRTHTTCISSKTLANLKQENFPAKFFAIGKVFRNETLDWKHNIEFNQTEGIVIDENANFRHLFGYLKMFFKKMGFEEIRFRPSYFPYTEPSVEIDVFHKEKKIWLELGGAGIMRPEVVIPLLGKNIPVLAWGPGFDRMIMDYYQIKDLREMYKNNLSQLRKMKFWMKT